MRYGPWEAYHICIKCQTRIAEKTRMYNGGICPHYGHVGKGTICETIKKARRTVTVIEGKGLLYRKKKVSWEYKD
jgi:hypothetical protein